jgi:hypothetical protein
VADVRIKPTPFYTVIFAYSSHGSVLGCWFPGIKFTAIVSLHSLPRYHGQCAAANVLGDVIVVGEEAPQPITVKTKAGAPVLVISVWLPSYIG